jgi:hypothetical protein
VESQQFKDSIGAPNLPGRRHRHRRQETDGMVQAQQIEKEELPTIAISRSNCSMSKDDGYQASPSQGPHSSLEDV